MRGIPAEMTPMYLDARPAADDLAGAWDRVRAPFAEAWTSMRRMMPAAAAEQPATEKRPS